MKFDEQSIYVPCTDLGSSPTRPALVQELLDNGRAERVADPECNEIRMDAVEAVKLSSNERHILGLPDPYPYTLQLEASGAFGDKDLSVTTRYYSFPNGALLPGVRTGAVLEVDQETYLLSIGQYKAVTNAESVRGVDGRSSAMQSVARLKEATKDTSVLLDDWLESENIVVPQRISLRVERRDQGIHLSPELKDAPGFTSKFEAFAQVQDSYQMEREDGGRTRVVLTAEQKEQLKKIKRVSARVLSDEDTLRIVENGDEWLGDEVFDLDQFSQRVLEIGIYRPRYYPFIKPYETEWFPGFVSESPDGERKQVDIRSSVELTALKKAIENAESEGAKTASYRDHELPIDIARQIVDNAEEQLEDRSQANPSKTAQKNVLIIKENVEDSEFISETEVNAARHDFAYEPPSSMRRPFEPKVHQKEALAWLQTLCGSTSGVLLADDMGLGKTLTVLAFLRWADERPPFQDRPHLVVAPVSLLDNWEREYEKFFIPGRPHAERLHGRAVKQQLKRVDNGVVYLTTYEAVRKYQLLFGTIDWGVVALDEVQRIKTPGTLITNAAKALKAEFRIGMTGTPVENTLVDLWCIMDFLVPGFLGSAREFKNTYEKPQKYQETGLEEVGETLRARLGVLLKRRLKNDVLGDLPSKREHRIEEHMTHRQAVVYRSILRHVNQLRELGEAKPGEILSALTKLRLVSDHPALVGSEAEINDSQILSDSGKMLSLRSILQRVQRLGEKAIVFAELKRSQRMVALMVQQEFGFLPRIVNGDMPANANSAQLSRQQAIDEFESSPGFSVIIMSPIAAGVGLNVTAANHVIHYSRHWNPAKEQQATDRAYRIGQENEVHVYYLLGTLPGIKTFDQLLDELLSRKKVLAEATLFPSERIEIRSDELLDALSELDEPSVVEEYLSADDVRGMDSSSQRAAIGALIEKSGFDVDVLAVENNHGAELLARKGDDLYVLSCASEPCTRTTSFLPEAEAYFAAIYPTSNVSTMPIELWEGASGKFSIDRLMVMNSVLFSDIHRFQAIDEGVVL